MGYMFKHTLTFPQFAHYARTQKWYFRDLEDYDYEDTFSTAPHLKITYPTYPSGLWRMYHTGPPKPSKTKGHTDQILDNLSTVKQFDEIVTRRDVLTYLGIAQTSGSLPLYPPNLSLLIRSFQAIHKPNSSSLLTTGARALSKHCHRDRTEKFWGESTGTTAEKNIHAEKILALIISDVSWCNMFCLHDTVNLLEIRNSNGYGARWLADGSKFRGFVEPQMADGYEKGWIH